MNDIFIDSTLASEVEPREFKWSAFASDLGLPVGEVPKTLKTNLGNGQPFLLSKVSENVFSYRQQFGCLVLDILND